MAAPPDARRGRREGALSAASGRVSRRIEGAGRYRRRMMGAPLGVRWHAPHGHLGAIGRRASPNTNDAPVMPDGATPLWAYAETL